MCICDVVALQQFDVLRVRDGNQHILPCDAKCFPEDRFDRRHVLDDFKEKYRVEAFVGKGKSSFGGDCGQSRRHCRLQIMKIHVTADTGPTLFHECEAVSTVTTSQIENF